MTEADIRKVALRRGRTIGIVFLLLFGEGNALEDERIGRMHWKGRGQEEDLSTRRQQKAKVPTCDNSSRLQRVAFVEVRERSVSVTYSGTPDYAR